MALRYPAARAADTVDDYHGRPIRDPYRWMEDLDSPELAQWIADQNRLTDEYLASIPSRERFRSRITELWDYAKVSLPIVEAGQRFYQRNSGLQKQAPIFRRTGDAPPVLVLDPNVLSADGSTALMAFAPSPDAALLAYTLADGGADWQTIHVRDLATGVDRSDRVEWMRFSALSWTKDSKGFFYSRFPEPPKERVYEAALSGHALYYHRVGTPQDADVLVYERRDLPTWFVDGVVTDDGRYLLITLSEGATNSNRLYYADLGDPARPDPAAEIKPLFERDGAEFSPVGNTGATLLVRTDESAPNRKIVSIDLDTRSNVRTIVQEREQTLDGAVMAGGRLLLEYLVDVQSRLQMFDADGAPLGGIDLPGTGVLAGMSARDDDSIAWVMFSSPLQPATVLAIDVNHRVVTPFEPPQVQVDLSRFETTQHFAVAQDGTRVPFFVTAPKGLRRDGQGPLVLYGYGGFSVNILPAYRPDVPAWLEQGGVWVTANLRGGAEYGESWHRAGIRERKQNVFDDFIAVAEHLVREGFTTPSRLAIMGGSNGGLLVAAAMEQRPELFAAVLPAVGVLDMLRYDRFTGGRAWVGEYGSSSEPADFKVLIAYSPLHNVVAGTCYPATLVTTADRDDRVVPSHSFKFVAELQRAQGCDRPVLIRVETQASHGYRPTDRRIAELADQWAFIAAATRAAPDSAATGISSRPVG